MKKERFYYAVASFMNKNGTMTNTTITTCATDGNTELFPLMEIIKHVENVFADTAIRKTITIHSMAEISKEDYKASSERWKKLDEEEKEC